MTAPFCIDLEHDRSDDTLTVRSGSGAAKRKVSVDDQARIDKAVKAVAEAEQKYRSGANGSFYPKVVAARGELGDALFELLDGADRLLARHLAAAAKAGESVSLVVRMLHAQSSTSGTPRSHPCATWRLELARDNSGVLATRDAITLAVQLGVQEQLEPDVFETGRLRVLFMAYSPLGVEPVLDYEAEEDLILQAIAPFSEQGRAVVHVVEDGSLAELERRLMTGNYDVVHLSGHGIVTDEGPKLCMEDEDGRRDDVGPERLAKALRGAARIPPLVMIASCHSAESRDDLPSLAASLVARGIPNVVGWVNPVRDDVASAAAQTLYKRLCAGDATPNAIATVRRELAEADERDVAEQRAPSLAAGTLHLVSSQSAGARLDHAMPMAADNLPIQADIYRYLGVTGQMRVLKKGFVGRRRELQKLVRVLRDGKETDGSGDDARPVAGAVILGMKGVGKSCLAGRAIERIHHVFPNMSEIIWHGALDESTVLEPVLRLAEEWSDTAAEEILRDAKRTATERVRLVTNGWKKRRVLFVLDDFEQNLEVSPQGDAKLSPFAAEVLAALMPTCHAHQPKLLVTTTASFPSKQLAIVELGSFGPPAVRKLWYRGAEKDEQFRSLSVSQWTRLANRLGRNARVLDWARTLVAGRTPEDFAELVERAESELPELKSLKSMEGAMPSKAQLDELATVFLRHIAFEEAASQLHLDALTFVRRARVYEVPVPLEALTPLTEGLALEAAAEITGLANLGLLEVGQMDGKRAHRVSPLVEPEFRAETPEVWHRVAARFFEKAADVADGWTRTILAWEHALEAQADDIADRLAGTLDGAFNRAGRYADSLALARRHHEARPKSLRGAQWCAGAHVRTGKVREGNKLFEVALKQLGEQPPATNEVARFLHDYASSLRAVGDLESARARLKRSLEINAEVHGTDVHPDVAASLHALAGVLKAQGDLPGARARLERSLEIKAEVHGTDVHPSVAASLHALAGVLQAQGDLPGARARLERSLEIKAEVHGTDVHPDVAASLHELAGVLQAQGDLPGARARLERSLEIHAEVHGTDVHPSVAASLHALAGVLRAQGDLPGARARLERSLEIEAEVHGTDVHPDVAASLHALAGVLKAQGDLPGARARLERSLEIQAEVHGTDVHPDVAASLHELAGVLKAQGDLPGARARLERSLEIQAEVHGTDVHPDVAFSLHNLGTLEVAAGDPTRAIVHLRRSLQIKDICFETRDHYMSAETEFSLGMLLLELGETEEGTALASHAVQVLQRDVPGHPILAQLREMQEAGDGASTSVSPADLARQALSARSARAVPAALAEGIAALEAQGRPHDVAARCLRAVAEGDAAPSPFVFDDDVPDAIQSFVRTVWDDVRRLDRGEDDNAEEASE